MSPTLPLKENSRELVIEVARALEPRLPQISEAWRRQVMQEFSFDPRTIAALKRLTIATGCSYFAANDFYSFFENLAYFGTRLAKLGVDTRAVARTLEIFSALSEQHLREVMPGRETEAAAAMEMLSSAVFVTVSGAYFDAKSAESAALLAVMEAEYTAPTVQDLLDQTLEVLARTFGADHAALLLRENESGVLRVQAGIGLADDESGFVVRSGEGFAGGIVQSGEPQIILDVAMDERVLSPSMRQHDKTLWGVPLSAADNSSLGVVIIGFGKPYYEWLPRERHLMQAMAHRAGMAIERARMTQALREREETIARLSGHLMTAQEEERRRISRELHDETGQALMVIRLYLGMLETSVRNATARKKIVETVGVVDRTVEGLRRMIAKLSPLVLEELGLVAAIRKEAKDLAKSTGVAARVSIPEDFGRLDVRVETAIYRVLQEALHNVAKHAQASNVNVSLAANDGHVQLIVEDDGVGMSAAAAQNSVASGQSFGLAGIKERVTNLGGTVRVCSAHRQGTRLEIIVPAAQAAMPKELSFPRKPTLAFSAAATQGVSNAKN